MTVEKGLSGEPLGQALQIRGLKVKEQQGDVLLFNEGTYNGATGEAKYSKKELPYLIDKMEHTHKATTESPLFFLNIFFGLSLLFFVLSHTTGQMEISEAR